MKLERTATFKKRYGKKNQKQREKVKKTLSLLATNPRHPSLHTHKVQGTLGIFECYIDDSYRVTFEYGQNCIVLRNTCEHNAVLRTP